jgi:hypothetical protein
MPRIAGANPSINDPMLTSIRSAFTALCLLAFLSACSNQPSAADAERDAQLTAKNDLPSDAAFVVADLKRENGWPEEQTYKIHFTYNLKAKVDYPQLVVELLKKSAADIKAMPKADRAAFSMQVGLGSMMAAMSSEVPDIKAEIEGYRQYPAIVDYIRSSRELQDDTGLLASTVYLATTVMQNYGIQKGQPAGTAIPRQVTFTYRKTEKGWQKLS